MGLIYSRSGEVLGDDVRDSSHQHTAGALGLLGLGEGVLQLRTGQSRQVTLLHRLGGDDDEVGVEPVTRQGGEVVLLH